MGKKKPAEEVEDRDAAMAAAEAPEPSVPIEKPVDRFEQEYERTRDEAESLNVQIVQWTEEGQTVCGIFHEHSVMPDTKFDVPVQRYLIQTAAGLASCILGSATDKELVGKLQKGDLLRIEYQGKKDIGGGRSVNIFDVKRFGHA